MSTTAPPKTVLNHEILHPGYVPGVDNVNPHDALWRKMSEHNKLIPQFKTKCMDEAEHKDRTASMYKNIFLTWESNVKFMFSQLSSVVNNENLQWNLWFISF